ncbi:MAG: hypothetical protein RL318_1934 [Fibrobacterota bacterium]|jgi:hypothetical protein
MDPMKIVRFVWSAFVTLVWSCLLWGALMIVKIMIFGVADISIGPVLLLACLGICIWLAVRGKLPGVQLQPSGVNSSLISQHSSVFIARRFIAQDDHIAYYQDVQRAVIRRCANDPNSGLALDLYTKEGLALSIEQSKFSSNARKAHKIKASQEAKMKKVSEKILKRLTHLQPSQIQGTLLSPLSYQARIERKHNPSS